MKFNICLVGQGQWAQKYISTLSKFPNINLQIANRDNWKSLIFKTLPEGVIVCTPPDSHIEIATYSLKLGIATMIEKPLSLSLSEANVLKQFCSPILVNNIHLFSEAYQNLRNFTKTNKINKISSLGFNNGPIRPYSSLWDYGCHDLSMILDLAEDMPEKINAEEIKTISGSLFKIKLQFKTFDAECLVGNGGQKPVRKLKIDCGGLKVEYNDKSRPAEHAAPLEEAIKIFLAAIAGHKDYRLGIGLSLKVTQVLESCEKILAASN